MAPPELLPRPQPVRAPIPSLDTALEPIAGGQWLVDACFDRWAMATQGLSAERLAEARGTAGDLAAAELLVVSGELDLSVGRIAKCRQ